MVGLILKIKRAGLAQSGRRRDVDFKCSHLHRGIPVDYRSQCSRGIPPAMPGYAVMHKMNDHDRLNQDTWAASGTLDWLGSLEGFVDAGERTAYARIAELARDQPILDLGVGAGRTIPMLQSLSRDYVAIDYTPAMVERARQRFPGVDIQLGDARDLSR